MTDSRRAQEVLEWAVRRRLGSVLCQASAAEADAPPLLLAEAAAAAAADEGATAAAVADEGASSRSNSMRARDEMHRALLEAGGRVLLLDCYADVCCVC
jgi:thiol:disulfide interchange protein